MGIWTTSILFAIWNMDNLMYLAWLFEYLPEFHIWGF